MKVILDTGSTIRQGIVAKGGKKMTEEYVEEAAVCHINPKDYKRLWIEYGHYLGRVKIITEIGEIVLNLEIDNSVPEGLIFVPRGPWINYVTSEDTFTSGSPYYKGMVVEIKGTDENVLNCKELMQKYKK